MSVQSARISEDTFRLLTLTATLPILMIGINEEIGTKSFRLIQVFKIRNLENPETCLWAEDICHKLYNFVGKGIGMDA